MNSNRVLSLAGVLLALATLLGAFGAHGLKNHLTPESLQVYETGIRYHFFNALGLLSMGVVLRTMDASLLRTAAIFIVVGIVLFSGSLYALTFGAPRLVGVITPIGGVALIVGWLLFAGAFWRQ